MQENIKYSSCGICQMLLVILKLMVTFLHFSEILWDCGLMPRSTNYFPFCVQQTVRLFQSHPPSARHCSPLSTSAVFSGIRSSLFNKLEARFKSRLGWMEAELPFPSLAGASCHQPWRHLNLIIGTQTFSTCLKGLKWWVV